MHIIKFYQSMLESLGFNRDGDLMVYADDGTPAYFTYNKEKRRLVLPTNAMIKAGMEDANGKECHAFHPLCESVLTGESGTIRFLKRAIRMRLWINSFDLIDAILDTAAEGKTIKQASYKKFMTDVICQGIKDPKLDDKLRAAWVTLRNHMMEVENKKQTNLFIASDMSIEGVKYVRVANFKHIFEEESYDDTATYFGVKLPRKQDKVILHRLLMTVFGWYPSMCGSNDNRPYFGCLARGWAQWVMNYNNVVKALREHCALKPLSDEWIGQLDELQQYDNVIQTLPYNTGSSSKDPERDTTAREYSVTPTTTSRSVDLLASEQNKPEQGSLEAFFDKALPKTVTSTGLDISKLTPAQQKSLRENGHLNGTSDQSIVGKSLSEAMGQTPRNPLGLTSEIDRRSLLSTSTASGLSSSGNSLLNDAPPRLGGLAGLGGETSSGPRLGGIDPTKPKDGFHW